MKLKNRPIIKFLTFVFLFGNFVIGFALFESHKNLVQTEQLVRHTQDVLYQSGNILSKGVEIETTARGYVITKDSTFLKPLYTSEKTVFVKIGQLRRIVIDNPAQVERVDSINICMQKRLNCSLQMVRLRNTKGLAAAIDYSVHERGYYYSEKLRQLIFEIQQEERTLLKQREEANNYSVSVFNWLSVVTLIFMILLTILLRIATLKYLHQNDEIEKSADELVIANIELLYQKEEKGKRAAELLIANRELLYQNEEKQKRADELLIANEELVIQSEHKEKRQMQLLITNLELLFQNEEKEKRAAELSIANKELVFQNREKEKRAVELSNARKAAEEIYQYFITRSKDPNEPDTGFCQLSERY
jgi:CHASE3 domain sensor protein